MLSKESKIVITGAAGFIASCVASFLKRAGYDKLTLVDDFEKKDKDANSQEFEAHQKIDRSYFINHIGEFKPDYIIHLGARTDTTEMDESIHTALNLEYSIKIWEHCTQFNIPLIYASSAATYGGGEYGYEDDHSKIDLLKPLNPYGDSKQKFDQFALAQSATPPSWYALKFFNIYGPNEFHKGRMASVIFHAYHQIKQTGGMKLFRSHNAEYKDGEQMRDFVYVKDVISVIHWLMNHKAENGIYNLGSGQARTFIDLVKGVFKSLDIQDNISFIDTPEDIREKYQYFTQASMQKLKAQGYNKAFYTLEEGVKEYIQEYLVPTRYY